MFLNSNSNLTHLNGPHNASISSCVCQYNLDTNSVTLPDNEDMQSFSTLETITFAYTSIHGILSLIVCAFGIPTNMLNITVLTRKHMRSPVNCILTWLAIFDLFTMTSYVPFALHFYCFTWNLSPERNSLGWMTFLIFHVDFTSTTHTISIWLCVTLAVFRYKHIFSPAKGHLTRVRRMIRARIAVFIVIVLSIIVMIPNYLMNRLKPFTYFNPETNTTQTVYVTEPLNMETSEIKPVAQASLLLHSVLAKLLPCVLMVVYGGLLVKTLRTNIRMLPRPNADHSLYQDNPDQPLRFHTLEKDFPGNQQANNQDHELSGLGENGTLCAMCSSQIQASSSNSSAVVYAPKSPITASEAPKKRCSSTAPVFHGTENRRMTRHQDNSRTTRMLLVVITLFLVTELPQGILIVLSATISGFFMDVYVPLGDIMDMLALVNNGINFLLYCIMSRDFRKTLLDLMKTILDRSAEISRSVFDVFRSPDVATVGHNEYSRTTLIITAKSNSL